MKRGSRRTLLTFVVGAAMASSVLVADDPLTSRWRPDGLRIDGVMTDWPSLTYVSKEVSTSVVNDSRDVYVLVATSDPSVSLQLRRAGLAVYIDSKGGKGRTFGIRVPPIGSRLEPGVAPSGTSEEPPILSYFDVLGPGDDDIRREELGGSSGIDLRIGANAATVFIELKMPLVVKSGEVGLGFVTPEVPRSPRTGRGGRGMVGMSGGMGMPPELRGKSLNIWKKVVLAKGQ